MTRLTYHDKSGCWGLKGLDWKGMVSLPPQVYGALCKLKDMEDLIDRANAPGAVENGDAELAAEQLLAMGTAGAASGQATGETGSITALYRLGK